MRFLATPFLHFFAWLLLNASLHVEAYFISPSCASYGQPRSDIGPVIEAGMEEAYSMAKSSIKSDLHVGNDDPMDNSKLLLFPKAEAKHYEDIISM
jgi:hypothetical protein